MTPVLSSQQIREWDQFTLQRERIREDELMERAAGECFSFIEKQYPPNLDFFLVCGTGNNGGDGLVLARLLHLAGYSTKVFIIKTGDQPSSCFNLNLKKLESISTLPYKWISSINDFPTIPSNTLMVDALFGTGLKRPPQGLIKDLIQYMNQQSVHILSIDMPSGLYCDSSSLEHSTAIVKATITLTFQVPKLAFLLPENQDFTGEFEILNIGLHPDYLADQKIKHHLINLPDIQQMIKRRKPFSHKGTFGHALLLCGSHDKAGAAVLSSRACLRSGVGLLTVQAPKPVQHLLPTAVPEAMLLPDSGMEFIQDYFSTEKYDAAGIGPGLGTDEKTAHVLKLFIQNNKIPIVFDADALNILSENKTWLGFLQTEVIMTPHVKEFERLFGASENHFEQLQKAKEAAIKYNTYIVLKGRFTRICTPSGNVYFNTTGNSGMATGGSGDVLTGVLTGLLAQDYSAYEAALCGVYLHGLAGDLALSSQSEESMMASDLIEHLGKAFKHLHPTEA